MDHDHGDMNMCKMNASLTLAMEAPYRLVFSLAPITDALQLGRGESGYEFLRHVSREYDDEIVAANKKKDTSRRMDLEDDQHEDDGLLSNSNSRPTSMSQQQKVNRSLFYAILVGISFWLMLVFMTYNGFLMISVVIGAGLGHYAFGSNLPSDRGVQCH